MPAFSSSTTVVAVALALDAVFVVVAFGLRTWLQARHFGDRGWRLGRPHSVAELVARVLLVAAGLGLVLAAGLVAAGGSDRGGLVGEAGAALGTVVALAAIGLTTVAQLHMGESWRIGIDPDERTPLVTGGLYRWVRNPIYTGMAAFAVGHALLLGSGAAAAAALAMITGVEVQVRAVEEPYLRGLHGDRYRQWAARAGRFVPGIGRERQAATRRVA